MQADSPFFGPAAWLAGCLSLAAMASTACAECPPLIGDAERIIVVTTANMQSVTATLRRFERPTPSGAWHEIGIAVRAVVGSTGLGWGAAEAARGDPQKHEGDRRTPAGLFRLGAPFGQAAASLPGYMQLQPGREICVDDPASPHYGQIVSRVEEPTAHGEDMGRVSLYRRGMVIDYPVNASARSGSCIFLHVWRSPARGTVGCVATAEPTVAILQGWAKQGDVIAILPEPQSKPLLACLAAPAAAP